MGKLEYYKTVADKSDKFIYYKVDTKEMFDKVYSTLQKEAKEKQRDLIYRGVNDATFKLYNSAQRYWIQKEFGNWPVDFHGFIQSEIDNAIAWQNNLLDKFYQSFGHPNTYELAVLSFLQHYSAPTPLLDWTYNVDCALFFAIDKLSHREGVELDNYCSLYVLDKGSNERANELINYSELHSLSKASLEEIKRAHSYADSSDLDKKYADLSYSLIKDNILVYISDVENNGLPSMYTNTNFNIINQEGLFLFNNSPDVPLEGLFKGIENQEEGDTFVLTKIYCIEIHKNLVEHIRVLLDAHGIKSEFVYPQEEKLAWDSYLGFMR